MKIVRIIGDFHLSDVTPRSWAISYFDNCLHELELLTQTSVVPDHIIVLGDFFDKPTIPEAAKVKLVNVLEKFKERGIGLHTIIGNHDIISYNISESVFERTSLNLISQVSSLNIISDGNPLTINGIEFKAFQGCKGSKVPQANDKSVLLAHAFLNNPIDELLNLEPKDLTGYGIAFFGHDHEPHKTKTVGSTKCYRPGAFSRTSSHKYNLDRKPTYIDLSIPDGCKSVKDIVVSEHELHNALPSTDLFREEAFVEKKSNKSFETNLSQVFANLVEKDNVDKEFSLSETLKEVGAPDSVINYVRFVHQETQVNWN